jgi:hypothetical protein
VLAVELAMDLAVTHARLLRRQGSVVSYQSSGRPLMTGFRSLIPAQ